MQKEETMVYLGILKSCESEEIKKVQVGEEMHDDPSLRAEIEKLKQKCKGVFTDKLPGIPPARDVEHAINLISDDPVFRQQFRLSPLEIETLKAQVEEMLSLGLLRDSISPYGAPVLFVKKPDGSLRMVIDYRALNQKTIRDRFPLPRMADLVDRLAKARYFSKMDLNQGFYQIRLRKGDEAKTAFSTPFGHYEFLVMPMGLCNSPSTFQRMMRRSFGPDFDEFVLIYLDDILIFSSSQDEHLDHMSRVLRVLEEAKLYTKESKCLFGYKRILFIGHLVGEGKRMVDPKHAETIKRMKFPKTVGEVRSLYGMLNHIRDHIPGLSEMAKPILEMLKKGANIEITPARSKAMDEIKEAMGQLTELQLPRDDLPWVLETDASGRALGSVV